MTIAGHSRRGRRSSYAASTVLSRSAARPSRGGGVGARMSTSVQNRTVSDPDGGRPGMRNQAEVPIRAESLRYRAPESPDPTACGPVSRPSSFRAHINRELSSTLFLPTPLGSRRFTLPVMPDPTGIGRSSPYISRDPRRARATRARFSAACRCPRPPTAAPRPASSAPVPRPGRRPGHTPYPAGTAPAAASPVGRARPRRARSPG